MNDLALVDDSPSMGASNTESIESSVTEALVSKRRDLRKKLEEIEGIVNQINEEHAVKINEIQARKKPLEEALFHVEALLKLDGENIIGVSSVEKEKSTPITTGNVSVTDLAFALLQQEHKPLHYKEIAKILQGDNIQIPGKNPAATLLSRISRDNRFKRGRKRGVYILAGWRPREKAQKRNTTDRSKRHSTSRRKK